MVLPKKNNSNADLYNIGSQSEVWRFGNSAVEYTDISMSQAYAASLMAIFHCQELSPVKMQTAGCADFSSIRLGMSHLHVSTT